MIRKREIYSVKFNKVFLKDDMLTTVYSIGESKYYPGLGWITPIEIKYANKEKNRLIISFEGGRSHEIGLTSDTELFWRDVETKTKKKDNGGDNKDRTDEKTT